MEAGQGKKCAARGAERERSAKVTSRIAAPRSRDLGASGEQVGGTVGATVGGTVGARAETVPAPRASAPGSTIGVAQYRELHRSIAAAQYCASHRSIAIAVVQYRTSRSSIPYVSTGHHSSKPELSTGHRSTYPSTTHHIAG
eukprot:2894851-Rhodomonas_salina.1